MSHIEDLLSGKEKLQFGNTEQIKAIDEFTEAQKEAEEDERIYVVSFGISGSYEIEISAFNEEEAEEKARDEFDFMDASIDWEIEDVWVKEKPKE